MLEGAECVRLGAVSMEMMKLAHRVVTCLLLSVLSKAKDAQVVGKPMLLNLENDIGKSNDVASKHPEVVTVAKGRHKNNEEIEKDLVTWGLPSADDGGKRK